MSSVLGLKAGQTVVSPYYRTTSCVQGDSPWFTTPSHPLRDQLSFMHHLPPSHCPQNALHDSCSVKDMQSNCSPISFHLFIRTTHFFTCYKTRKTFTLHLLGSKYFQARNISEQQNSIIDSMTFASLTKFLPNKRFWFAVRKGSLENTDFLLFFLLSFSN